MKYCTYCGEQLVDEAVICPKCGCPTDMFPGNRPYGQSGCQGERTAGNNSAASGNQISALAIVGFIFAFLQPIVGLICSIVAYRIAITECSAKSKSFSKSGIILSVVFLVLWILFWILILVLLGLDIANDPNYDYYRWVSL